MFQRRFAHDSGNAVRFNFITSSLQRVFIGAFAALLVACLPNFADATLISYWHFNNWDGTSKMIDADAGVLPGRLRVDANWNTVAARNGTLANAVGATPAGQGLGMLDPDDGEQNTGEGFTIDLDTTGFKDLEISWAEGRDLYGMRDVTVLYRVGNTGSFTAFGTTHPDDTGNPDNQADGNDVDNFDVFSHDMSELSELDDEALVQLRFRFDTTLDADGFDGENVLDNIRIEMNDLSFDDGSVPEPSMMVGTGSVLLAFGATYWRRRRKTCRKMLRDEKDSEIG